MKKDIENILFRINQHTYFSDEFDGLSPYESIMQIIIEKLPESKNDNIEWNNYRRKMLELLLEFKTNENTPSLQ